MLSNKSIIYSCYAQYSNPIKQANVAYVKSAFDIVLRFDIKGVLFYFVDYCDDHWCLAFAFKYI
jgi:hypothetical protein